MQILGASSLWICDDNFTIMDDSGIVFDEKIIEIGNYKNLCEKHKNAESTFHQNCILMPGLINSHTHIEFSKNKTSLEYGSFETWLQSVIKNRENLISDCKPYMKSAINEILSSGTTTIGAISSYGIDLQILAESPLRVMYFNEIIGSNPALIDVLYNNFIVRLEESKKYESDRFYPAIALHSPYSLHYTLAKKAVLESKSLKTPLSVHLLESKSEREWLESGSGYFKDFFKQFFNADSKPSANLNEFLTLFEDKKTLFTHLVNANKKELEFIKNIKGTAVTCTVSNKLLGGDLLDLSLLDSINLRWILATDGLSSNFSLSLLDEIRISLFAHSYNLESFSKQLWLSMTKYAGVALGLNIGEIKLGYKADFAVFELDKTSTKSQSYQLLLNAKRTKEIYISGEKIKGIL